MSMSMTMSMSPRAVDSHGSLGNRRSRDATAREGEAEGRGSRQGAQRSTRAIAREPSSQGQGQCAVSESDKQLPESQKQNA